MITTHSLGFPRIGAHRQLKFALEAYWKGEINETELAKKGQQIRHENWGIQANSGLDWLPVGDFSWYDHVLDMTTMLGVIPSRFKVKNDQVDFATYFQMARGQAPYGDKIRPCEMTKWFDTNYHYIVPELNQAQSFQLSSFKLFDEINEAHALGYKVKPVILGPLSYLWLSKTNFPFDKLSLLTRLIKVYQEIFTKLLSLGIKWIQIDEPILVLDLPESWREAFVKTYHAIEHEKLNILLTTYFGGLGENLEFTCQLPVTGLHVDAVRSFEQISKVVEKLRPNVILSLGIIDGRNVWKIDLKRTLHKLKPLKQTLEDKLWIAGSCSFLHCPVDLDTEITLDKELKQWLAFSKQKTREIVYLAKALNEGEDAIADVLAENQRIIREKQHSSRIHNSEVKKRCKKINELKLERNPYAMRRKLQQEVLKLPLLPTTTVGSFPQTSSIRKLRSDLKNGMLNIVEYEECIRQEIQKVIEKQEKLGLDVFVHGESERSDMVEYFAEQLEGFILTTNGWVQSYGSRCVKPPIIYGDISRSHSITISWIAYAQSLTYKPVKGVLTGPITMLMWSFVRDNQSRYKTAEQIALALRDEVIELEQAGINVIQIDEPAFREGLPLCEKQRAGYLKEAIYFFKLVSSGVKDSTQIHTHMCYSKFNEIINAIAEMDADVISIEASRSNMELLEAFKNFSYPNEIGLGVYDVHSLRIPSVREIKKLIEKASTLISIEKLWINPDCGLKTRAWSDVDKALKNMVKSANLLRKQYVKN
ncbi:MAG: 5-methyltetrahydropteroyltriglutamate--homocysteine S-methyltransferase [Gammaproteobacteria bacterium]|nr:5-methyltetrahydropteroyltriglutamate--homocysteine S-methyltransferase [Gammaproteobacteria bacterium]MCW5583910.1 5-methyltetrahydropteroyltriglutamate--homocysteine S-methyltransferase [Gammaproteobacteria bacterium]